MKLCVGKESWAGVRYHRILLMTSLQLKDCLSFLCLLLLLARSLAFTRIEQVLRVGSGLLDFQKSSIFRRAFLPKKKSSPRPRVLFPFSMERVHPMNYVTAHVPLTFPFSLIDRSSFPSCFSFFPLAPSHPPPPKKTKSSQKHSQ